MDSQQPIKQKDLQYFLNEVAKESPFKYENWAALKKEAQTVYPLEYADAWERYAAYREQQAKHAGFIEGCKAQRIECAKNAKQKNTIVNGHYPGIDFGSIRNAPLAQSPYEPREKGGEGDA